MFNLIWLAVVSISALAGGFNHQGGPQKVTCVAKYRTAKQAILEKTDINVLLEDAEITEISSTNPDCHKYENEVVNCQATIDTDKVYLRYVFGTQSGSISAEDKLSGQKSSQTWTQEHELTKSGYLTASVSLTNTSGGLMGENQIFQIEYRCQARNGDW